MHKEQTGNAGSFEAWRERVIWKKKKKTPKRWDEKRCLKVRREEARDPDTESQLTVLM